MSHIILNATLFSSLISDDLHVFCITFVLKMGAVYSSETSVTHYQAKLCRAVDEHKLIHAFVVFVCAFYFTHSCTGV